ncbi:MAG: glycosyltransferase, partial [Crocinitomicaceae bacterium]
DFIINFTGSLYDTQPIEQFLHAFKEVIKTNKERINITIQFPGLNDNPRQTKRVKKAMIGFEKNYTISDRLPRQEVIDLQLKADLMLMLSHENIKGIPSSKLYEYIGLNKAILLYPNDKDIIADTLIDTNLGFVVNSKNDIIRTLENLIQRKIQQKKIFINHKNTYFYSRKYQAKFLGDLLNSLKFEKKLLQIGEESKTGLNKILIISYFAPPSNFVASERISSWMKDLTKFGIHPVLLTRHWTDEQTSMDTTDVVMRYQQITGPTSQTHKIAIKKTILEKLGLTKFKYLRKTNSILVYLKLYLIPTLSYNKKFLKTAQKIIKDQNIDKVVISGTPFSSFWIGYKLKQWNSNIQWYPDYRDTWNSIPNKEKFVLIKDFFLRKIEMMKEKKWTTNANMFFTVSEDWKQSISSLIGKKGLVIMNGFDKALHEIIPAKIPRKEKSLVITYAGTLYPSQDIFRLLDAVSELMTSEQMNIKVNLIGIDSIFNMKTKILASYKNINHAFNFSTRISKRELEIIYQSSDLLWLTSFTNIPGWYPVKLFDYASTGVPILLFPTDNGVMQEFISRTRTGFTFSDKEKLKKWIKNIYGNPQSTILDINYDELGKFQRITYVEGLAKFLHRES